MRKIYLIPLLFLLLWSGPGFTATASPDKAIAGTEKLDMESIISHHISDSHWWNIFSYHRADGTQVRVAIPLPIIVYHQGSVFFDLASIFEPDRVVAHKGHYFKMYHDIVYLSGADGQIDLDATGHPTNARPVDLSITKNVTSLLLSVGLLLWIFISIARRYRNQLAPRGLQAALEPIVLFVYHDVILSQIGPKGNRYAPFLLTLFFFIWINNVIGLFPIFPGSSNLSGNIAFTGILAVFVFVVTTLSGNRDYWKHILVVPGVPLLLKVILIPIEIVSMFTKPFTLLIRLFANVTGGHIIIISLISMIFIVKSYLMAPMSVLLSLMIFLLEFIFGALQAYIFTLLSALYIGMAVQEHHSNENH